MTLKAIIILLANHYELNKIIAENLYKLLNCF